MVVLSPGNYKVNANTGKRISAFVMLVSFFAFNEQDRNSMQKRKDLIPKDNQ